jgi:diadenosine tetraphosphate (Ap4A) HIT family hydrolase
MSSANCPLCRSNNLLKVDVIAEVEDGYIVPAYNSPGNFLIIPADHTESPTDLPDTWWATFKQLLAKAPGPLDQYNISLNYGNNAGQTVSHLHFWLIPRTAGKPASGRGLASLIDSANQE